MCIDEIHKEKSLYILYVLRALVNYKSIYSAIPVNRKYIFNRIFVFIDCEGAKLAIPLLLSIRDNLGFNLRKLSSVPDVLQHIFKQS